MRMFWRIVIAVIGAALILAAYPLTFLIAAGGPR